LVVDATYDLPFKGNRLVDGWRLVLIFQTQSGIRSESDCCLSRSEEGTTDTKNFGR
jgi:hypothetical protein